MRFYLLVIFLCLIIRGNLHAGLLINECATNSDSDWVELTLIDSVPRSMDISGLYVTMYYGSNESLSSDPVTISSWDRPETGYDDRFVVVHLCEPGIPDETDYTGDINGNGYLDLYCNNYSASLWNTDGVVAIDTDDTPGNGGIVDFVFYSNNDGSPNSTILSYADSASGSGEWLNCQGPISQSCAVDIGLQGLSSSMSLSRKSEVDNNNSSDFTTSRFQTPGKENILNLKGKGRSLFLSQRKYVFIAGTLEGSRSVSIPLLVLEECTFSIRAFSLTGLLLYKDYRKEKRAPGHFIFTWDVSRKIPKSYTSMILIQIEATSSRLAKTEKSLIYCIQSPKRFR